MNSEIVLSSEIYPLDITKEVVNQLIIHFENLRLIESTTNTLIIEGSNAEDIAGFMNYLLDSITEKELN